MPGHPVRRVAPDGGAVPCRFTCREPRHAPAGDDGIPDARFGPPPRTASGFQPPETPWRGFCFAELLPDLEADESWLLEARRCPEGRLLARSHRV